MLFQWWILAASLSVSGHANTLPYEKELPPHTLVIFGATGDLTKRGLVPALLRLAEKHKLPEQFACVGIGLGEENLDLFRRDLAIFLPEEQKELWNQWDKKFHLIAGAFEDDKTYQTLRDELKKHSGERLFYLAIPPSYFSLVIEQLDKFGLLEETETPVRLVIEKPFGLDLASAEDLQKTISRCLDDHQVYRMDHFLGIGMVQQLSATRFSNPLLDNLWNRHHIDHVTITVSEDMGVGTRGKFWEQTGYLRDVVQNHMMQLVSLIGMEKPDLQSSRSIQQEKHRLLQAIRLIPTEQASAFVRRGQYEEGVVKGNAVPAYRKELDVPPNSPQETAIAAKLFIDNDRWSGVPFYLKGGKRLDEDRFEIAITFKSSENRSPNQLLFQIQPVEKMSLKVNVPGKENSPHCLTFPLPKADNSSMPAAYEFLLSEAMRGNPTHFVSFEEIASSWKLFSPVFDAWENGSSELIQYTAGSEGPEFP
jgi:glucose-6-phosphate 1-dehydrogenase